MDIDKAIRKRRSVRRYKPKRVPKAVLKKILESARWAPSVHNLQPWRFIIVEGRMKDRLARLLSRYKRNELLFVRMILKEAIRIIDNAPVAVLVYKMPVFSKKIKIGGRLYFNNAHIWEIQSVACALQNMILTVHSLGLGAAWLGIPMFRSSDINKLFKIDDELMAILTIGYPAEKPPTPKRKGLCEIASLKSR